MRIIPPAKGEPFYNPDLPDGWIHINNREPGEKCDFEARQVVDAGFWNWFVMACAAPTIRSLSIR